METMLIQSWIFLGFVLFILLGYISNKNKFLSSDDLFGGTTWLQPIFNKQFVSSKPINWFAYKMIWQLFQLNFCSIKISKFKESKTKNRKQNDHFSIIIDHIIFGILENGLNCTRNVSHI